jgi:hypothetical protein
MLFMLFILFNIAVVEDVAKPSPPPAPDPIPPVKVVAAVVAEVEVEAACEEARFFLATSIMNIGDSDTKDEDFLSVEGPSSWLCASEPELELSAKAITVRYRLVSQGRGASH